MRKPASASAAAPRPSAEEVSRFREGTNFRLHEWLGAHPAEGEGRRGVRFGLWAPEAAWVSVVGAFNSWSPRAHRLRLREDGSGVWEGFVPGIGPGEPYLFHLGSDARGEGRLQPDPLAFHRGTSPGPLREAAQSPAEPPFARFAPRRTPVVWSPRYPWKDEAWMRTRGERHSPRAPLCVYQVHLPSWRRVPEEAGGADGGSRRPAWREAAPWLERYLREMDFTHAAFLPCLEGPDSLFRPYGGQEAAREEAPGEGAPEHGAPEDLMELVDLLHGAGFGVLFRWNPSAFGLGIPEWGRGEVRSLLGSSALFWLESYHLDGLIVDGAASPAPSATPRALLHELAGAVREALPGALLVGGTAAEGLLFDLSWGAARMRELQDYLAVDPLFRKDHHHRLVSGFATAFAGKPLLPLAPAGEPARSVLASMPGDDWMKLANLRLLLGIQYAHPGKKLLFMGTEIGQWEAWGPGGSVSWHLLDLPAHRGVQRWVRELNELVRREPALHRGDFDPDGFEWVDDRDRLQSVIDFLRRAGGSGGMILVVANCTPVVRYNYRVGVPLGGTWRELLNSDAREYGGSGQGNFGRAEAAPLPFHGREWSLSLTLPPLGVLFFRPEAAAGAQA